VEPDAILMHYFNASGLMLVKTQIKNRSYRIIGPRPASETPLLQCGRIRYFVDFNVSKLPSQKLSGSLQTFDIDDILCAERECRGLRECDAGFLPWLIGSVANQLLGADPEF
jgi:hypothetical protein